MPPPISRVGWIRIAAITIVGLAIVPFTPGYNQYWTYHRTKALEGRLKPILATDPRFKTISLEVSYGMAGVLWVNGQVDDNADTEELKTIIGQNNPSPAIEVRYPHTSAEMAEFRRIKAKKDAASENIGRSN